MRKFRELDAVLFAEQGFVVSAFPDIVNLNGLVALGGHAKLAGVVVVDGQDVGDFAILGLFSLENLFVSNQWSVATGAEKCVSCCGTFVGLKFAMTSLTGEVTLILVPRVRVMFNWGVSAGDDSISTSIGVADIVTKKPSFRCCGVSLSAEKNLEGGDVKIQLKLCLPHVTVTVALQERN